MVIGNGMIAKAFSGYKFNDEVVIFASGVSNSKEERKTEYDKEIKLLKSFLKCEKIIYFSTISIYDKSLKKSKYIKHKLKVEKIIKKEFKNYLIFRLPNVVGKSDNLYTSFNFFKNKIIKKEKIYIQENATRYFIDIQDLSELLPEFILKEKNKIINVCFNNKIFISELVSIFEKLLKIKVKKVYLKEGENYSVDNSFFIKNILQKKTSIDKMYNEKLIKKYL